jgi:hypothetical protein
VEFALKGLEKRAMPLSGVLLVIVESGATLPPWLASCQDRVSDTMVLASAADEQPTRFAARAIARINALRDTDQRIQAAVLIASYRVVDADILDSRLKTTQSILSHLALHNRGRLLLLTGNALAAEAQMELLKLAGTLSEQLHGTKLTVALHFGAASAAEPPRELLEATPSSQRRSRRPSGKMNAVTKATAPTEDELVSAVVQTSDSSIESTG